MSVPTMTEKVPFHILPSLRADGPHPDYADKLMLFGQFVGVWAMDIRFFDTAGNMTFNGPGEWKFSWILDGRAIQDVLTYAALRDDSKTAPGQRRIGTTLRYYDPKADLWRAVWLGATSGILIQLTGKPTTDGISLEGREDEHTLNHWTFTAITADRFHWRGLASTDDGASWQLEQEMFARRK
jgi:hypothetical protein